MPRSRPRLAAAITGLSVLLTAGTIGAPAVAHTTAVPAASPALVLPASTGPAPGTTTARINAGGAAGSLEKVSFASDGHFSGGRTSWSAATVTGTTSSSLFQSRRVAPSGYSIPVTNGAYDVTLLTAETWWSGSGKRRFSATVEGQTVWNNIDLFVAAGGKDRAYRTTKRVTVTDGRVDVRFSATLDNAVIAGITVVPAPVTTSAPAPSPTPTPTPTPAPAPAPTPAPAPAPAPATTNPNLPPLRSGLPWRSGVYVPGSSPAKHEAFGTWRGSQLDVVVDWPARRTWNDIVNPTWLYDRWKGTPYTKVFGVAPIPEGESASLQQCAAGAYNDKWRQFGTNIKAAGLDKTTIIRLGWEFNGNWYKWSAHDPAAFAGCWRQIHTSAESTAPALRWDWTVNRGAGQSVSDPRKAWPGDAYVDIVGVDSYDGWPAATTESGWATHYSGGYGLKFWADFARSKGKLLSVPEWGVYPGTAWAGNNGGDNPFYVRKMAGFFHEQRDILAYEAYFNEAASYYAGSLYGPQQNPKAAAEYLARYKR